MSAFQGAVDRSPFLKRVLIPFWTVRIVLMVVEIGLYGVTLGDIRTSRGSSDRLHYYMDYSNLTLRQLSDIITFLMIAIVLCLLLDLISIVQRAARTLTPLVFLVVSVLQTVLWTVSFILSMITDRQALSIGLSVLI